MSAHTTGTQAGHIEVRDLNIGFKARGATVQAVKSVSLDVQAGEFVSLIGPSGCGKSTLMNAVAGFTKANSGVVTLDGKRIDGPGSDRGVVFQQYSLFPWMTVRKNVEFGLKMANMAPSQRETQARTLLGLAGLLAFENHYPSQLSGGMKQRVGIVRALATSPQVLLMDEPFGALDSQTRSVMQEILTNMWQRLRLSVLFITHDIEEAIFLSDRIYVMTARPGRIKADIRVPLPRPRTPDMMDTPEFAGLVRSIKKLIREESLAAMGGELRDGGCGGLSMEIGPEGVANVL
ncbi:ABC transporter ATP-binding protein [Massilia sp. Root335]|jgi:NitT/TauT family transport system ATP-binding protein|uniref:ABC transporter ATP-binding protein n=1 Tax=Massilia sp. Root335 TaxID=1736517 RepID=UPI0006FA37CE|nr:ABC transporter ATP-binding protein [Massilia sp. Root335]KQV33725.1 sulfonate ABC transporter ATP-binding protein [Massilia sp. Root335]